MVSYIAKCINENLGVNHKNRVVQELSERIKTKFEMLSLIVEQPHSRSLGDLSWFNLLNKRFYKSRTAT